MAISGIDAASDREWNTHKGVFRSYVKRIIPDDAVFFNSCTDKKSNAFERGIYRFLQKRESVINALITVCKGDKQRVIVLWLNSFNHPWGELALITKSFNCSLYTDFMVNPPF